jgi:hypothetical protein
MVSHGSLEYLNAYFFFGKGYLPNAGGWLDQPMKFVQAILVVEREAARVREEKEDANKPGT